MSRPAAEPDSDDAVDDLPTDSESEEPLPSVAVPVKAEEKKSPVKKAAKKTKTTPPK